MKEKRKGFTLIELLAVIVILAIIALIAIPNVLGIINKIRKGAFSRSVEGIVRAANLFYIDTQLELGSEKISFNCDDNECISTIMDSNGNYRKIAVDGKMGVGYVNISTEGKVSLKLSRNGYCAYKYESEEKINIVEEDCNNITIVYDSVPPTITETINPVTTSNSIIVGYKIEENESGIKEVTCKYGTSEGIYDRDENTIVSESACSIKQLSKGTYYYQICATDFGKNTSCITGNATTSDVPTPIIEYKDENGNSVVATENGYVEKDYITVTYNNTNITNASNYIKTNVNTKVTFKNTTIIKQCGNDISSSECSEISTTVLNANTWYKIEGSLSVTIEFTEEGEVVAVTKDESENINANNGVSRKIDNITPIITGTINPVTTSNSITIGYKIEENESGIKEVTCKYGTSEGIYDRDENTIVSESACSIKQLSKGTYYYQICATDFGKNTSCITGNATTSDVPTPIIEYKDENGNSVVATENGYVEKDYITVTYNNTNITNASNYIKTNVNTKVTFKNTTIIKQCGNDISSSECSEISTTVLNANTWYKIEGSLSVTIEFTEEGEVVAVTKDESENINANNGVSRHIIPLISQISFDNNNVDSDCTNLKCAIDELYERVGR